MRHRIISVAHQLRVRHRVPTYLYRVSLLVNAEAHMGSNIEIHTAFNT